MNNFNTSGRTLYYCEKLNEKKDSGTDDFADYKHVNRLENANLISSVNSFNDNLHYPVLDFDFPARLIPSSTIGNSHLYIDKVLTWKQYEKLLIVMKEIGLLQEGYVNSAIKFKQTFVRLPWIKKGSNQKPPFFKTILSRLEQIILG